jgi:hypothetical protein
MLFTSTSWIIYLIFIYIRVPSLLLKSHVMLKIIWLLWKESLNSDDHQFHEYQQNQANVLDVFKI